jgi:dienelactone hydrolase
MIRHWVLALLAVFPAMPAMAAETAFQEAALAIPMTDGAGNKLELAGKICVPQGAIKPRVVLHNHGRSDNPRQATMLGCDGQLAQWYLARGFAVAFMQRRGYGATGGRVVEDPAGCGGQVTYVRAALEAARDIAATVTLLSVLPYLRSDGMVVQGHSAGGLATIAFGAFNESRAAALVNFAGGRLCGDVREVWSAAAAMGEASKASVPMLWMYAANDFWWPPGSATPLHQAYTRAGGKATYVGLPAYGNDRTEGHNNIISGAGAADLWGPPLEAYLKERGVMGADGKAAP